MLPGSRPVFWCLSRHRPRSRPYYDAVAARAAAPAPASNVRASTICLHALNRRTPRQHEPQPQQQAQRPATNQRLIITGASTRPSSTSSNARWKARAASDQYAREAKVQGLKSRAAFKLLQINDKHRVFTRGATVVDLGFAPGSWSQVAANRTAPRGRVVGVDILPAQPPRGVSTIQGNFLSPQVQAEVRNYVLDPERGRHREQTSFRTFGEAQEEGEFVEDGRPAGDELAEAIALNEPGYIDRERRADLGDGRLDEENAAPPDRSGIRQRDEAQGRVVDVVLSDMCEPWDQTAGFGKKSISDPYHRMMNTSGNAFRDHAGSMDLCTAALSFSFDTLRRGGHFVCKFYQGAEDKLLEKRLKRLFEKVHRDKPAASRSESREGYFVALRRKEEPTREQVFAE